ncbi:MAG: response regulator [Terriglobales bacterium]
MARKILLADDSVTAQNMGRRILSDAGYEVTTVNNGSAALKKIAEAKPDLIVLDVYMPGYGGLEVCQRLRESHETARIPILLTVGKLEPFKPEEARRVRADAFIVKPFEASELLTALTKLEDRIVPQPAPYKPGRFAKAISALESDSTANDYGDLESGWKNRLKIPVPQSHGPEIEVEGQAEAESRKPEIRAEQKPAEIPPAVPRDITPEEIAAIHAAAAAFGSQNSAPAIEPEVAPASPAEVSEPAARVEEAKPEAIADVREEVAATFASVAPVEETQAEPQRTDAESIAEPPFAEGVKTEVAETASSVAAEVQPEPPLVEVIASSAPAEAAAPKVEERDDFAAALETLTPANGHGLPPQSGAPRWMAELVAVTEVESALILEQEMEKAVAAMAAVHAGQPGPQLSAVESSAAVSSEEAHQETPPAPSVSQEAEPDEATSLVAAMMNQTALPTLSDLVDSVLPRASTEAATTDSEGAAFAAAAAGSADAVSQSAVSSEAPPAIAASSTAEERQRESELAAAWESWKHIRESVVEPQLKSQITETLEPPAAQADPAAAQEAESDAETVNPEEAVASIVDSVLADLKPKLMEEISRKMGKEKKRKS